MLKDIINSKKVCTIVLNKIFRQAAMSKIITNAHRVNQGENFLNKEDEQEEKHNEDFFYIKESSQDKILKQVLSLSKERLKTFGDYDFFKNIQVLSPTKKGMLGTKELNISLQQHLNPHKENSVEKQNSGYIYRKGDRIIQNKNNYDIYWEKKEPIYESGSGVFNGELGTIQNIDEKEKQVKIRI